MSIHPLRGPFSRLQVICDGEVIFSVEAPGQQRLSTSEVEHAKQQAKTAGATDSVGASLYGQRPGSEEWLEVGRYKPMTGRQYFRRVYASVKKLGIPLRLDVPTRRYAEYLMDVALQSPRGRNVVGYLSVDLVYGENRQQIIKGTFSFVVTCAPHTATAHYCVIPVPERSREFSDLLARAAAGKMDSIGKTPHFARSGRARVQSLSR